MHCEQKKSLHPCDLLSFRSQMASASFTFHTASKWKIIFSSTSGCLWFHTEYPWPKKSKFNNLTNLAKGLQWKESKKNKSLALVNVERQRYAKFRAFRNVEHAFATTKTLSRTGHVLGAKALLPGHVQCPPKHDKHYCDQSEALLASEFLWYPVGALLRYLREDRR